MYTIEKQQNRAEHHKLHTAYFARARDAFAYLLQEPLRGKKVLLPAYIGWSSREGSGIFDPILSTNTAHAFYGFDAQLNIDTTALYELLDANEGAVLLLVHYFGFVDLHADAIKNYALKRGVTIIEDAAHAFFTFFAKPLITSNYYIFSLHKMFALKEGGMLLAKTACEVSDSFVCNPFAYNHFTIAQTRVANYNYLAQKLACFDGITLLRPELGDNIPQTLPLLVASQALRDDLYFGLNELGFGAVSLYHELIDVLDAQKFTNESFISKHILNLPVHQDVSFADIDAMIEAIRTHKLLKTKP